MLAALLFLSGCGSGRDGYAEAGMRTVTLPDGTVIQAEMKVDPQSQAVGMMYRDSLPKNRGMLFLYAKPFHSGFWMYNCKIPLDIIWMDSNRKVVEISSDTPPCLKPAKECPNYGGHKASQYVLEIGGGEAQKHGVRPGQTISF